MKSLFVQFKEAEPASFIWPHLFNDYSIGKGSFYGLKDLIGVYRPHCSLGTR